MLMKTIFGAIGVYEGFGFFRETVTRRGLLSAVAGLALVGVLLVPASALAQEQKEPAKAPSLFAYGINGLFDCAALGLATGHLATGHDYDTGEWKTLVFGAGIGAVVGVSTGVVLGLVDRNTRRSTGWFVLRDLWYGALLGGLTGAAIGALVYIETEHTRDILTGAAIGGLVGAGVGIGFGVLEGVDAPRRSESGTSGASGFRLTVTATAYQGTPTLLPTLLGRFF